MKDGTLFIWNRGFFAVETHRTDSHQLLKDLFQAARQWRVRDDAATEAGVMGLSENVG